jgi:hypothetical protein
MTLAVFGGRGNRLLFSFIVITFVLYNTTLFLYGLSTSQIGFILIVVFQFFLTLLTFIYLNNDVPALGDKGFIDED